MKTASQTYKQSKTDRACPHAPSPRVLCVAVLLGLMKITPALAAASPGGSPLPDPGPKNIDFDSSFFQGAGPSHVDISRFNRGAVILPGEYTVDVQLNDGSWQGHNTVAFRASKTDPSANATPCFTRDLLTQWGVNFQKIKNDPDISQGSLQPLPEGSVYCGSLGDLIPEATTDFDVSSLSMRVSIPQLYLNGRRGNWTDPSQWQNGINAGYVDYSFNANDFSGRGSSSSEAFITLNSGINLGGWRVRQLATASWDQYQSGHQTQSQFRYHSNSAYVQHDLTPWRSQLTVGEYTTSGRVFDAIPFRGINISSDDRMLPDADLGFAPVVRGFAETNAKVTIRQRGLVIYQTTVAPGPFAISDLPTLGGSGTLDVTVTEADGRTQTRAVPYSYLSNLLRPGIGRYSISAGQLSQAGLKHHPSMMEATYQRGINNLMTAYGGYTRSTGYDAVLIGAALNTRIGAVGVDATYAQTKLINRSHDGGSLHATFTKNWLSGTNLTFGAYRYSSPGYYTLTQAAAARYGTNQSNIDPYIASPQRSQIQLSLSQSLGRFGSLSLDGSDASYWNRQPEQLTYSASYGNSLFHHNLNVQLSVQRTRQLSAGRNGGPLGPGDLPFDPTWVTPVAGRRTNTQIMLTMSIPLGHSSHSPSLASSITQSPGLGASTNATVSGTLGNNNQLSYSAGVQRDVRGSSSYNLNGQYQGNKATVVANVGRSSGYRNASVNVEGSAVVFGGGVLLGSPLDGSSFAIVHAEGAEGAKISSTSNTAIDKHGYAVVPDLSPYRNNQIEIDPQGLPLSVELNQTSQQATPRAGSAVLVDFKTHAGGRAALIDTSIVRGQSSEPIPFGSDVFDEDGNEVGVVGQNGRILARVLTDAGTLSVKWGEKPDEQCQIEYSLTNDQRSPKKQITQLNVPCRIQAKRQPDLTQNAWNSIQDTVVPNQARTGG